MFQRALNLGLTDSWHPGGIRKENGEWRYKHHFFRRLKHFGKIMFLLISMSESCGQNHTPSFQLSSGWCLNLSTAFLYSKETTLGTTLGSLKSLEHTCVQQWRHPNLIQLAMLGRITGENMCSLPSQSAVSTLDSLGFRYPESMK